MTSASNNFDVLIVGAGAGGLAAAAALAAIGKRVCVLEARDRVGGRILSRHEPDCPIPLELGAEFIHGMAPATLRWLRRFNTPFVDATQTRLSMSNGKLLDADDVFDEMKRGLARVRKPRKDLPFADFLNGPARAKLSTRARQLAYTLAEGFDAADATRASTLEILKEWSGSSSADAPTFRPLTGYGGLVGAMAAALNPSQVHLQLNTIVKEVLWKRGEVRVNAVHAGASTQFVAPGAIITLPLGVLQLPAHVPNAVRFEPPLESKTKALAALGFGPVIKIVLRFREAFWETLADGAYRNAAFFHTPKATFPTFWSSLPVRSTVLVAWTAGPSALHLAGLDESQLVAHALESLESLFGKRARVRAHLLSANLHDWQADPFACGAYSFVNAGGQGARMSLSRPMQDTLFFAGEATDTAGEPATVAGALQSGERAVRELMQGKSQRKRRQPRPTRR